MNTEIPAVEAVEDISMEEVLGPNYREEQIKETAEKVKACHNTAFITDAKLRGEVIHYLDYGLTFGQELARLVSDLEGTAEYLDNVDADEECEDSPAVKAVYTAINNVPETDHASLNIMLCRVLAQRFTLK